MRVSIVFCLMFVFFGILDCEIFFIFIFLPIASLFFLFSCFYGTFPFFPGFFWTLWYISSFFYMGFFQVFSLILMDFTVLF